MADHTVMWAAGQLASHITHRDRLVEVILADDPAMPGAQSLEQDRVSGHSTVLWCEEHELDPADCHEKGRWEGDTKPGADLVLAGARKPCTGAPMPVASDSVGELVVSGRAGKAAAQLAIVEAAEAQIVAGVEVIERLRDQVLGAARSDRVVVAGKSTPGDPGCQSCERLNIGTEAKPIWWWNEPTYNRGRPTDFGAKLPKKTLLCEQCAHWILNHDHDVCIAQNETAKKANRKGSKGSRVKKIPYSGPTHLPPVEGTEECLRNKFNNGPDFQSGRGRSPWRAEA